MSSCKCPNARKDSRRVEEFVTAGYPHLEWFGNPDGHLILDMAYYERH